MNKPRKMAIYNLFPPLAGKFSNWGSHLERVAEMGFNWVFINPIQYPGFSGSLYSVKDYFAFNPLFLDDISGKGPEEQVREVTREAEESGLNMMIDLVVNHCAVDSDLLKEHPLWFKWERPGEVAHPFCHENGKKVVWGDLAKFDHLNTPDKEGLVRFFLDVVESLIGLGFKGFRCDAAYQIPPALWEELISRTRGAHPGVLFFAETLGCSVEQTRTTARAGFDYVFNSSKWWDFHAPWLMADYHLSRDFAPSVSFPESHDTPRLATEVDDNINAMRQRYLFSALFSAGVMMPMGFEFGFRKRCHVVESRPEDWEHTGIDITPFIARVNRLKSRFPIFQEEAATQLLPSENPNVLFMWKGATYSSEEALIILNKDIRNKQNFHADNLYDFVQIGSPLADSSPENPTDFIPTPFSYDLLPGQGIVLTGKRNNSY